MSKILLPCPFCGGNAKRIDIEDTEDENFGGSYVCCTKCQSSTNIEFGRKENFINKWNTRKYKNVADELAYFLNGLVEGDDPDDACEALIEYGYCDEDGFWIYEE